MPTSAAGPLLSRRFTEAFALASDVHATQVRKGSAVPYLAHLMSVAALVLENGGDEDTAIAALLHDAVEDSSDGSETEARIRGQFGDRVADIVLACSDAIAVPGQKKAPWPDRKAEYISRLASETDPDVFLVSACDKLHNARSIVADLRTIGPATWDRFSQRDPAAQLWYYETLAACYHGKVPAPLADELDRTVAEMRALANG
ncbi:MAG TPA: HD domain-containing protein [Streptosporangiaceae bacterium]|jgi:GTP pyrophosphokinase|nr:HD domain-containing protein [Streptosporangiaceae bacterium]